MLRIAIQTKGRLNEDSISLLSESGIKLTYGKRQLLLPAKNYPLEALFLRDDDIPQTVAEGVADIGIVGENEFLEKKQVVKVVKKLGFSKCRLSLAIPQDTDYKDIQWFANKTIATSYPIILQDYLDEKGIKADIHIITGSVEVTTGIGLADAIFDIVSSGSTLISNRLKEVEVVMKSEAVLVANPNLSAEKQEQLDDLLFRINAVQLATDKKYVLMNVPNEKLEQIISLIPVMKSPTVVPLLTEGWSSLHAVIDEKQFWEIISKLKTLGAEGILVMPIEKIIT